MQHMMHDDAMHTHVPIFLHLHDAPPLQPIHQKSRLRRGGTGGTGGGGGGGGPLLLFPPATTCPGAMRFLLETPWLAPYTAGLRGACWRAWVEAEMSAGGGSAAAAAALCRRALAEEGEVGGWACMYGHVCACDYELLLRSKMHPHA